MKIDVSETGAAMVISLSGELDHHAARDTSRVIDDAVVDRLPRRVVFDLSGLTFMDSSGIAVLLKALRRMEESEGEMVVKNTPAQAKKVLKASNIDRLMKIE